MMQGKLGYFINIGRELLGSRYTGGYLLPNVNSSGCYGKSYDAMLGKLKAELGGCPAGTEVHVKSGPTCELTLSTQSVITPDELRRLHADLKASMPDINFVLDSNPVLMKNEYGPVGI